ncbi:asparagine synthase (glutamine-hydrolyzing) [Micromonospora aurantiaca]|uniref:asparagine synthase (glutamine-hydrolyzing) n=1 Tax=Micromonospora aurantiaca (nom. illeg.) TaxID=47850 RepID=A0A3M9K080_9ACTN|nr:asparagine synthase (glutamine-hydrolyzing) [Micromonospora aurantiaca]RNH93762.1 asparagine synthase (glutamine-hydrolyzing) [Micromonospora aurantiaca]
MTSFNGAVQMQPVLRKMADLISHRGPDGCGLVTFDGDEVRRGASAEDGRPAHAGLAHRLLSIVGEPSDGLQPVATDDGHLWMVFNGEIHNYVELRDELRGRGYDFHTDTDTEVVLHAYREWGERCFSRLNGMWSLAVYDRSTRVLTLARDRLGIKPLFYVRTARSFVFGSEIKVLAGHPEVELRPNQQMLYRYLAHNYRWVHEEEESFYEGIRQVRPGHVYRLNANGQLTASSYWHLDPSNVWTPADEREATERLRELLLDAVRIRMRASTDVAVLLSGGVDSASVTAAAGRASHAGLATFSARFRTGSDEGPYIAETRRALPGRHVDVAIGPDDFLPTLQRIVAAHDVPLFTQTWYAHWRLMSAVASEGFRVVLTGHGGDELFAGYAHHDAYHAAERSGRAGELVSSGALAALAGPIVTDADPVVQYFSDGTGAAIATRVRPARYADVLGRDFSATGRSGIARVNVFRDRGYLAAKLYQELAYETIPIVLCPEDRSSMAFSVETRPPFLDHRIVELAFALPDEYKLRHGVRKWVLRESMRGLVPDAVLDRADKQGINVPTATWFRTDVHDDIRDVLASALIVEQGIVEREPILRYLEEHRRGEGNHYLGIWQWLNVELWLRSLAGAA